MTTLILGATGNVGVHVVDSLIARGEPTRIITRDRENARRVLPDSVDIIEGDMGEEKVLIGALDDVDAVFLLTPHSYTMADLQLQIIRMLRRSSVKIVKLSATSSGIRPDGPFTLRQHWEIEQVLTATGQNFVILRPNGFMQTLVAAQMLPSVIESQSILNSSGSARLSMIDARDIGEVAARVLTSDTWDGQTLVLTGPRAVTFNEIAALIGEARGEYIRAIDVTPADVRASLLSRGVEGWEAGHIQEMHQLFRDGGSEEVTGDVQKVLEKSPRTIENFVRENFAYVGTPTP
jgi:NAD(P)H dehydrogenase (quinone)